MLALPSQLELGLFIKDEWAEHWPANKNVYKLLYDNIVSRVEEWIGRHSGVWILCAVFEEAPADKYRKLLSQNILQTRKVERFMEKANNKTYGMVMRYALQWCTDEM